jgi:hypothetical protein
MDWWSIDEIPESSKYNGNKMLDGGAEGDRTPDLLTASFELSVVFIDLTGLTVGKMRQIAVK